ncbi:MAG: hypothetical protein E2604_14700 [Flavobacterium sp.]|nr:hypothetical protein [Flavobacterium sp.]
MGISNKKTSGNFLFFDGHFKTLIVVK